MPAIERWFRLEWMEHTPPFYTSVDLRNAGFKLAPVDTNLFPGGFNNLTPEMLPLAVQAAMAAIEKICPEAKNLLLIPEKHTRNTFYLTNVQRLVQIFHQAGLNVRLGTLDESIKAPTQLDAARRRRADARAAAAHARPARAEGLRSLHDPAQQRPVGRPARRCWRTCTSSTCCRRCMPAGRCAARRNHFQAYEEVAKKFAKLLGMDPWLINPMFAHCGEVNFSRRRGHGMRAEQRRGAARQGPPQVQGIRHPREAVRHRQGRRRHLRHGHHDGARCRRSWTTSAARRATR